MKSPRELLAYCREKEVKAIDLRFVDLRGTWHHKTIPIALLTEDCFDDGFGIDGGSIRGWRPIEASDLLIVPEVGTWFLDPFTTLPTLNLLCNVQDPVSREDYGRDPRFVARKSLAHLASTHIADAAYFGPESSFFIFDDVRFESRPSGAFYFLDSEEAEWNRGREERPNLAYKLRHGEGYSPCAPADQLVDIRLDMMQTLIECGIQVECQQHEVATAGQCEIDIRYDTLLRMADMQMIYKYVVKNIARRHGKTVTFMPQPLLGDQGSGMHVHVSLWKQGLPLFAGNRYAGLSEVALYAIGGLLHHAPAVMAFTNPTTNSYKRLVAGAAAPINLGFSQQNRSAACRIPQYSPDPKGKRIEFRCPDSTSNPYFGFAAILMAMIDGIQNKIDPGHPIDRNHYERTTADVGELRKVPQSLEDALDALEDDQEFLLRGDVFTEDLIDEWLTMKRMEAEAVSRRPHPYEFSLYFDA